MEIIRKNEHCHVHNLLTIYQNRTKFFVFHFLLINNAEKKWKFVNKIELTLSFYIL